MNIFEIEKGFFKVYYRNTASPVYVDDCRDFRNLYEPEYLYQQCKEKGISQESTIDLMLKLLFKRRILKGGYYSGVNLCVAFIGPRGSGKSVGATIVAIWDGFVAGRRVVSNMPIELMVRYKDCEKIFRADDLDTVSLLDINEFQENYSDCLMIVDEVNMVADAMRSTSNQAYFFDLILQQMRHRALDFIFTLQSDKWETGRMRFQTDFFIRCRDMSSLNHPRQKGDIGRRSEWQYYDMSGLETSEILYSDQYRHIIKEYQTRICHNTPYWDCYSTMMMQKREKFVDQEPKKSVGFDAERLESLAAESKEPIRMILSLIELGRESLERSEVWRLLDIENDPGMQSKVGKTLKNLGCKIVQGTKGRKYQFPSQAEMVKRLADLSMDTEKEEENNGRKTTTD